MRVFLNKEELFAQEKKCISIEDENSHSVNTSKSAISSCERHLFGTRRLAVHWPFRNSAGNWGEL